MLIANSLSIVLSPAEARVLGSLVEKEITTPEYYPLSLNALINACNQKTNRDPVMELDEESVRHALTGLRDNGLAGSASSAESRVTKYEHRAQEVFNFTRAETAVVCVLLLRGPQTPGELRGRTERLHRFNHLDEVQATLQRLMQRDPPLVKVLARQPGTKEARYAHLLSGEDQAWAQSEESRGITASVEGDRLAELQERVSELQRELADLKQQFGDFRKQFEQ